MAALRDIARDFAAEIRDGIGWTIVYRTGRSWNALTIWSDIWNGEWETNDLNDAIGILKAMYNHTGLQGRLTADPELRYTQQGTAITSFTLASDTGRKTKDGKKITNFIECVAWRAQAEFVCKYLSKGRLVLVEGELTSRSYEDKDGNRRKAVEITVDSVHFCDSKKDGGQSSGSDFADPGYSEGSGDFTEIEDNGDLPF